MKKISWGIVASGFAIAAPAAAIPDAPIVLSSRRLEVLLIHAETICPAAQIRGAQHIEDEVLHRNYTLAEAEVMYGLCRVWMLGRGKGIDETLESFVSYYAAHPANPPSPSPQRQP